ncbi:MAG: 50S ribosomal protein L22 [Candidatus Thermoplasmatota archaeon]|nr:50S ribosomal protein L22 [Candidatus Thermoplasmatota archaeon]
MAKLNYSLKVEPEGSAKALGRELKISPKKSMELCCAIKGKKLADAKKYLEDVIALKRAVPFHRFKRDVPHRKGKGIMAGRYPVNAAKGILETLQHAEHNAEYKGLDPDNMYIYHIAVHRGRVIKGRMPRAFGRATPWDTHTSNIEVILKEFEETEEKVPKKRMSDKEAKNN